MNNREKYLRAILIHSPQSFKVFKKTRKLRSMIAYHDTPDANVVVVDPFLDFDFEGATQIKVFYLYIN